MLPAALRLPNEVGPPPVLFAAIVANPLAPKAGLPNADCPNAGALPNDDCPNAGAAAGAAPNDDCPNAGAAAGAAPNDDWPNAGAAVAAAGVDPHGEAVGAEPNAEGVLAFAGAGVPNAAGAVG